jgi:hypothetical protein
MFLDFGCAGACQSTYRGIAMSAAAEYRQYAEECLHVLRFTTSAEVKAALLLMAERWTKLADFVERAASIRPTGE